MKKIFNKYTVSILDKHGKLRFSSQNMAFDEEEAINFAWDAHIKAIEGYHSAYLHFPLTFEAVINND